MSHDSLQPVALEDEPMATAGREEGVVAPALDDLVHARPADAFAWLGPHQQPDGQRQLRVLVPHARRVEVIAGPERRWDLQPGPLPGLFEGAAGEAPVPLLALHFEQGVEQVHDAYSFGPLLDEALLQHFHAGDADAARQLGAVAMQVQGIDGVRFAVWAPTHEGLPWSAISTGGMAGAIRCGCATPLACGSCSCLACRPVPATNSASSAPTAG